jgi:hypothetical protein
MREREPRGHDTHKEVVHEQQHSAVQRRREEEAPDAGRAAGTGRRQSSMHCLSKEEKTKACTVPEEVTTDLYHSLHHIEEGTETEGFSLKSPSFHETIMTFFFHDFYNIMNFNEFCRTRSFEFLNSIFTENLEMDSSFLEFFISNLTG